MRFLELIVALVIGYGIGKLDAMWRLGCWINSLFDSDQLDVMSLLRSATRCDANTAFDSATSETGAAHRAEATRHSA
jgi:hypothetical protein